MDSITTHVDTINTCKLKMRTKIPCGRKCSPGEKFCDLCIEAKNKIKVLKRQEMATKRNEEHLTKFSLEDIDTVLRCFPIKN